MTSSASREPGIGAWHDWATVRVPYAAENVKRCQAIPDLRKWDPVQKVWFVKATAQNLRYLRTTFPELPWSEAAQALYDRQVTKPTMDATAIMAHKAELADVDPDVTDYEFGTVPYAHQKRAFLVSRDREAFALLMEQRTGKSKVSIDTACYLYEHDRIDAVVVLAPNGVKTNWVTDEIPRHTPKRIPWDAVYWSSGAKVEQRRRWDAALASTPHEKLQWVVVNIEALQSYQKEALPGSLVPVLRKFLKSRRVLLLVDESTRIKSAAANRTKATLALGRDAKYRRILSGMPVTQSPLDVFVPFKFLDPAILGYGSGYAFRNHFAIMGGFNGKEVLGYRYLNELQALVKGHSFRVTRDQCLDLPPKVFQRVTVALSPEQRRLYNQMREEMFADLGARGKVTVNIVLTQMIRFQQIVGGFLPDPDPDHDGVLPLEGGNPKLAALLDVVAEETRKVIIWARFRPELALIADALRKEYGDAAVVEFHGGISDIGRIDARTAFQDPTSAVRFFVGQQNTGGIGITLTEGKTVIYYSNTFSLEDRKQSEDRPEGIGQTESVTFIDLVAEDTVDDKVIVPALRNKQELATLVTGDTWKAWI